MLDSTERLVVDQESDAPIADSQPCCVGIVYHEEMYAKYGSEDEVRGTHDHLYYEAQCNWVKMIPRYVTACMVHCRNGEECGIGQA
jgi:hypothetical protein